jgi:hypothetical protein
MKFEKMKKMKNKKVICLDEKNVKLSHKTCFAFMCIRSFNFVRFFGYLDHMCVRRTFESRNLKNRKKFTFVVKGKKCQNPP